MRKLMYGALALGAAMAVSFGAGAVDASAAAGDITVTAAGDTLTIKDEGASTLFVGEAKVKKKEYLNVANWDVYEGETAVIDISKLSMTKDHFIQVKADYSQNIVATVKIEASDKITAKYNKATAEIEVKNGKEDYTGDPLTFRTESGSTGVVVVAAGKGTVKDKVDEGTEILSMYQVSGATLYVQAPETEPGDTPTALKSGDYSLKTDDESSVEGYTFKRASKEAKLAIGKLANAPKVKANYVKGEITVPKGAVYQYVTSDTEADPAVIPADMPAEGEKAAKVLKVSTSETDLDKGIINAVSAFGIKVKTPAVEGTKPKLASKVAFYTFEEQGETTVSTETISGSLTTSGKSTLLTLTNKTTAAAPTDYIVTYTKDGVTTTTTAKLNAGKIAKLAKIDVDKPVTIQEAGNAKAGSLKWPGSAKIYYLLEIPDSPVDGADTDNTLADLSIVTDNRTSSGSGTSEEGHTVTITGAASSAVTSITYGSGTSITSGSTKVPKDQTVTIQLSTTKAATKFVVTGASATASNNNKTYTFTMPDADVSIEVKS